MRILSSFIAITLCALCATAAKNDMAAPKIKANKTGFIALNNCPTSHNHVSVTVSEAGDAFNARIFVDGDIFQRFDGLEISGPEYATAHFLDANCDGYVDILLGSGTARNYSVLLLWDRKTRMFVKVDNDMNGYLLLDPSTKTLSLLCSASWCSTFYSRFAFNGSKMKLKDELIHISDAAEFGTYGVKKAYTVVNSEKQNSKGYYTNVVLSTNKKSQLPQLWHRLIKAYETALSD